MRYPPRLWPVSCQRGIREADYIRLEVAGVGRPEECVVVMSLMCMRGGRRNEGRRRNGKQSYEGVCP